MKLNCQLPLTAFEFSFYSFIVRQLHREFLLSGADVLQPLTFFASNANLKRRGINLTVSIFAF